MVTLNNRAFMHAQASETDIGRSPLILHMTSRQNNEFGPNAVDVGVCRPVEITLPPAADTDDFASEVRDLAASMLSNTNSHGY